MIETLQKSASSLVSVFIIVMVLVAGFAVPILLGFEVNLLSAVGPLLVCVQWDFY